MLVLSLPRFGYAFLQIGVAVAFGITAMRAWRHSRAHCVELLTAFLFGLLLEQGDIFLFGTYRYDTHWVLLGDVPVAIALTWAMIIVGAMNMTDALGIRNFGKASGGSQTPRDFVRGLSAPMADAVWAILLDLALDAVAIRLGLWTWTIHADEGWFGVPWSNFFAWLFVAFWFSFFTRLVRAYQGSIGLQNNAEPKAGGHNEKIRVPLYRRADKLTVSANNAQWFVPFLAFIGLVAMLVPFVALENTAALPFVPDDTSAYNNQVWLIFAATFALFIGVTLWGMYRATRVTRETADHWLLCVRLSMHVLFLLALLGAGIVWDAPLLLAVAVGMLGIEVLLTRQWLGEFSQAARARLCWHAV